MYKVLEQICNIAVPSPNFNNLPPCPFLAKAMATNKVSIQQGIIPAEDVKRGRKLIEDKQWAVVYWYPPNTEAELLELTCDVHTDMEVTCLYMHRAHSTKPMGMELTGKYPLLIVQSTPLLETARKNLPPNYPYRWK